MQSDAIHNAVEFGRAVQRKRKALGMTQRDLALAVGVGERFVVDLEKGKPTCELGRALRVAAGVGFRLIDAASAEDLGATQDAVPGFEG
ncbi:MAG: helix-turn-helix transcriptional regulator [Alphaproteobacteria bacterium]|jgi:y4mF family transcriptional regulator|nr:helix-turn-helix transcriptional regulator [Alphaproteobacteria bacterium]